MREERKTLTGHVRIAAYAFLLLVLSYLFTNIGFSLCNDTLVTQFIYSALKLTDKTPDNPDNVVLLDVQYDKQLVDAYVDGELKGKTVITNRETLYKTLVLLDSTKSYNYIFLDITFEDSDRSPYDSLLFSQIRKMDRIVIADSDGMSDAWGLKCKAGYVDYFSTMQNEGFSKYVLFSMAGETSMAAKAYNELGLGKVTRKLGLLCLDGGLAFRCITPKIRYISGPEDVRRKGNGDHLSFDDKSPVPVLCLGNDVLPWWDDFVNEKNGDFFAGKDIVIGTFSQEDMHDTYAGSLYGPIINYNAFLALKNGEHKLGWLQSLIIFALFFLMILFAEISAGKLNTRIPSSVVTVADFVIVWVVGVIIFWIFGQTYDVLIMGLFISIYKNIHKFLHRNETNS